MATSSTSQLLPSNGWRANLGLLLERQHGRTVVARRKHSGPLQVQRAFYPEADGTCHVYILHPPGGVVGGDSLTIEVDVQTGAQCLVTTPGAGKIYRNNGEDAVIKHTLTIDDGATLEWLPQETIVFDGSNSITHTDVYLQDGSGFCGWDIVCLGRPAAKELFTNGKYRQNFRIWRGEQPLSIENNVIEGNADLLQAPWGLAGFSVVGTFMCVTDDASVLAAVREAVAKNPENCRFSVTQLQQVLVARYLGHSAEQAKKLFADVWSVLRGVVYQRTPVRPRIWDT